MSRCLQRKSRLLQVRPAPLPAPPKPPKKQSRSTNLPSTSDSEDDGDKKKVKGLGVSEVKEHSKKNKITVTDGLPIPPFLLTVVAPRKSGKTNLVVDALIDDNKFRNKFDAVFIWSKTFELDPKWKNIQMMQGSVFTEFNSEEATELIETAEFVNTNLQHPANILFVFDDMITESIMNRNKLGPIEKIAVRGRHVFVSIIVISQQYMSLSASVRNNTTNMIVFRVRNGDEMEKIARENREWLSRNDFIDMFYATTKEPYSFLHINNQRQDPSERFHKNWNQPAVYGGQDSDEEATDLSGSERDAPTEDQSEEEDPRN